MSFLELLILAVGLSMDAFAVAICKGLSAKNIKLSHILCTGAWFGTFQGIMPLLGCLLGMRFRIYIERYDHWIAFGLLALIGLNMIREALFGNESEAAREESFSFKTMFILAIATSIDALAVGITLGLLLQSATEIVLSALFIAGVTFMLSASGVKIGSVFGNRFGKPAEIVGGIILLCIGTKILLEHLGLISF